MHEFIRIKGAREHNLKNISLDLPKNKFIVITGLSGSGKSSLAFDTLYAEGQRRYVESLSAYARQFLGLMNKPDVDSIEGLSPAISIEQKATSKNPRSTVGTITEVFDYLRLLFARIGTPYCPVCDKKLSAQGTDSIVQSILREFSEKPITIFSPIIRGKKGTYEHLFEDSKKKGFSRVRVDQINYSLSDTIKLDKYAKHDIELVTDRLTANNENRSRLAEAVETAAKLSDGFVIASDAKKESFYSKKLSCIEHEISFDELEPRMFSFNSPFGACNECHGIGFKQEFDEELIIPDKKKSILKGAINAPGYGSLLGWRGQQLSTIARHYKFDLRTPWEDLKKEHQKAILFGTDERIHFTYESRFSDSQFSGTSTFEGIIPSLDRLYKKTKSEYRRREMEKKMKIKTCTSCQGQKLKALSLAVKISEKNIMQLSDFTVQQLIDFFKELNLSNNDFKISKQVLKEIRDRLFFLVNVGLDYLTLGRAAKTLSGGESQRIRLATQIGSNLSGVMYVLDEPSIGLHQRDNEKLIETLHKLRDLGNTLIVVEHDEDTILKSDFVVDIGPGAGVHGGKIIAIGKPDEIIKSNESLTGRYLAGKEKISVPEKRRISAKFLKLLGAQEHNLKNIDVEFPLGIFISVTGVSGSGKGTLISDILYRALAKKFFNSQIDAGKHKALLGTEHVDNVINIDQSPIGRTPRSNPATYIGVFTPIRELFASTRDAKLKGFSPGRFSFNVPSGRCEECEGNGLIRIEMNFLADVYITCEECRGTRFDRETLEIKFKEKNISDVLSMTVDEAAEFFANVPSITKKLSMLQRVGLGYIKLGQSATTLSGGEAQRVKLTNELSKRGTGRTVYILDEPTTGLHFHDVKKLLEVLNSLVERGNTVIVIEHNLDVVKSADHIIDLGPLGGDRGGEIVAEGTPEQVAKNKNSFTGEFLAKALKNQ